VSCCGVIKDEKNVRRRWKGRGRVGDIYGEIKLPLSDAKGCRKVLHWEAMLLLLLFENNGYCAESAKKSFILTNVVPNKNVKKISNSAALVMVWVRQFCGYFFACC
jgi:hypothetical protein